MLPLSAAYLRDEAAAFAHIEALLWTEGPVCPACGAIGNAYNLNGVRSKPSKKNPVGIERHGLRKCKDCGRQFTVRGGSIFQGSHIQLSHWLQAIYLLTRDAPGISNRDLHRALGVTVKTAWFMTQRIREAVGDDGWFHFHDRRGGAVAIDALFCDLDGWRSCTDHSPYP